MRLSRITRQSRLERAVGPRMRARLPTFEELEMNRPSRAVILIAIVALGMISMMARAGSPLANPSTVPLGDEPHIVASKPLSLRR